MNRKLHGIRRLGFIISLNRNIQRTIMGWGHGMIVMLDGKEYPDFEKNPKTRSIWGEELIKKLYSHRFKIYRTDDIAKCKIKIEKPIKFFVDNLFKNKDFHSVDLIFIYESREQYKKRKKDEKFVRSIIRSGQKYNLGKFLEDNNYGILIHYRTHRYRGIVKRVPYLIPKSLFFVEVKTWLSTSKPSFLSTTELYKYLLHSELAWVFFTLIKIDLKEKEAEVNFVMPIDFFGMDIRKYKIITDRFITSDQLPPPARTPFPIVVGKGKPYSPFLEMGYGDEVGFGGPTWTYTVPIQVKE